MQALCITNWCEKDALIYKGEETHCDKIIFLWIDDLNIHDFYIIFYLDLICFFSGFTSTT